MIEAGVLDDPPVPKAIFDFHNWPGLPFGCACFKNGAIMASTDAVDIVVRGKSSHAALPHKGAESIVAASAIVAALQTIISRRISPSHPAVVTIGEIHGGSARNVIPSEVRLSGTIRMTDPAVRDTAYAALREITESTAIAYGARAEVKITPGYPITINNPDVMIIAMNAIRAELGESSVIDNMDQCLAGEDFSFFSEKIPATMFLLGTTKPGEDFVPLHNARFNFNDELIPYAVRAYCACVIEAQNKMR